MEGGDVQKDGEWVVPPCGAGFSGAGRAPEPWRKQSHKDSPALEGT